jgi:hypothetical protein
MDATTVSISKLNGSIRKPNGTAISPATSQRPLNCRGVGAPQWRTSRKSVPSRQMPMAPSDRPAESRGRLRVATRIVTKAARGASTVTKAAATVGLRVSGWVMVRSRVQSFGVPAACGRARVQSRRSGATVPVRR